MKFCRHRLMLGAVLVLAVVSGASCGHERKLVSVAVQPDGATFGTPDPNAQVIFTALGTYIHPPDTRDITDQVTWKTDVPQLITVDKGVVSPTGAGCGIANIYASMKDGGNLVTGSATITVKDPNDPNCP